MEECFCVYLLCGCLLVASLFLNWVFGVNKCVCVCVGVSPWRHLFVWV